MYSVKTFDVNIYYISAYFVILYFRMKLVKSTSLKKQPNTNSGENRSPSNNNES